MRISSPGSSFRPLTKALDSWLPSARIAQHAAALARAYAIGQGASTQAVLGIASMAAFGTEVMGPWRDILMVSAWCINLCIAQFLINRLIAPGAQVTKASRRPGFGRADIGAAR